MLTRNPIDRRSDPLLIPRLQAIHHPQDLRRVSPGARGIAQNQTDGLLRVNNKHTPDGKRNALLIHIRHILMIQHIIQIRHLPLLVPDDGETETGAGDFVNVFDPAGVRVDGVGAQADQLDVALGEFGLEFREGAQLGRADRGVVFGVREENDPGIADEFVEVNGAVGGVGLEVGRSGAEAEAMVTRFSMFGFLESAWTYGAGRSSEAMLLLLWWGCVEYQDQSRWAKMRFGEGEEVV